MDGELFVACYECALPTCRTCYKYECKEGSQVCAGCKIRFKHLKGCARVAVDEEEDDANDLENEFSIRDEPHNLQSFAELNNRMNHGLPGDVYLKLNTHFLMDDQMVTAFQFEGPCFSVSSLHFVSKTFHRSNSSLIVVPFVL